MRDEVCRQYVTVLTRPALGGKAWGRRPAVREIGPFEKRNQRSDAPVTKRPKPDFVRTTLNARELHAYYIALISSPTLGMVRNKLKLQTLN
jgi:hypothetical protein